MYPFLGAAQNLDKFIVPDNTLSQLGFMEYVMILENRAKIIKALYSSKLTIFDTQGNLLLLLDFLKNMEVLEVVDIGDYFFPLAMAI